MGIYPSCCCKFRHDDYSFVFRRDGLEPGIEGVKCCYMDDLKINRQKLEGVCRKHGVIAVYIHGSRVKGYAAADSDTDVAVVVKDKRKLEHGGWGYKVEHEIRDALKVKEPDVRVIDVGSSPVFLFAVVDGGVVIYESSADEKVKFEARVLRSYYDYQRLADVYRRYLFQAGKEERD